MEKTLNADVTSMQLLLRDLHIFFNYDDVVKEVSKTHSSSYLREKEYYRQMIIHTLPLVFEGKTEEEIYNLLLNVISKEL